MTVILRILTFLEMAMFSCTAIVVFLPSNINDEKKEKKKGGGGVNTHQGLQVLLKVAFCL